MAARYLLRIDDLCPAMNWSVWEQVERILDQAGARPLLAVVPANRDPHLEVDAPDPDFWSRVRAWQRRGWAIGLHGYEHRYVSPSAGIIGRNAYSEFAGLPEAEQRRKLENALAIFAAQGVRADAWVAPAHSFDKTTVRLLAALGVDCISDGYALAPFVDPQGLLWVPQQLGRFRWMPAGTWTVCLHLNAWQTADIARFKADVGRYRGRLVSLAELKSQFRSRRRSLEDTVFEACFRKLRAAAGAGK